MGRLYIYIPAGPVGPPAGYWVAGVGKPINRRETMTDCRRKIDCPVCRHPYATGRDGYIVRHTYHGRPCGVEGPLPERELRPAERITELHELIAAGRMDEEARIRALRFTIPNLRAQI